MDASDVLKESTETDCNTFMALFDKAQKKVEEAKVVLETTIDKPKVCEMPVWNHACNRYAIRITVCRCAGSGRRSRQRGKTVLGRMKLLTTNRFNNVCHKKIL